MSDITEKLALLANTKDAIKNAIDAKGQVVGDIPFSQYPAKIAAIETGDNDRLTNAVKVTAFTEGALSALLGDWKTGDLIPFYTDNLTASTDNQFPESGAFSGFISMGANEGEYFQILAVKTGTSGKVYVGGCIGSSTTWKSLGEGSVMDSVTITTNIGLTKLPFTKEGQIIPFELKKDTPEISGIWTGIAVCDGIGDNGYWQGQVFITCAGHYAFYQTYVEYGYAVPVEDWNRYDFGGGTKSASVLTGALVITGDIKDFDFGFEKTGDIKPLKIVRKAVGLPDASFDFYGWAQCQYWASATQYNVSLYIIQETDSNPRIFTAVYAKGYTPSWVELGKEPESGWLMQGDFSLIANSDRSFTLSNYVQRPGDKLWIEFAYLGDDSDGHMIGFSQGQSIIINPTETLNTKFYSLVTSGGSAKQHTVSFRFRMVGLVLYIYATNESTDGRDLVSQFRIKGIRVLRK